MAIVRLRFDKFEAVITSVVNFISLYIYANEWIAKKGEVRKMGKGKLRVCKILFSGLSGPLTLTL